MAHVSLSSGLTAALGNAKRLLLVQTGDVDRSGGGPPCNALKQQAQGSASTVSARQSSCIATLASCTATAALQAPALDVLAASISAAIAPPRTSVGSRRLTVPAYCVAPSKTKRRCRKGGRGGGDEDPEDGAGDGSGPPFGGNGDDWNGGWGDWDGQDDGVFRGFGGDFFWAWKTLSVICFLQTAQFLAATLGQPEGEPASVCSVVCTACTLQTPC